MTNALRTLEEYFLLDNRFIIGDELTLADFAAYSELGQAQQYTNVYDLSAFPNVQRWMGQTPCLIMMRYTPHGRW